MIGVLMVLAAAGCWLFALMLVSYGQTDIHLGFAGVVAALGAICLGLAGVISEIGKQQRRAK